MVDLTFARLQGVLASLAFGDGDETERVLQLVRAFQDAWSIVDALNRLRCLLRHLPGLKQKLPHMRLFYDLTEGIEGLRDAVQHLDSQIQSMIDTDEPAWGRLSWLTVRDGKSFLIRSSTVVLGSMFDSTHRIINPAGKTSIKGVDEITLASSGFSVVFDPIVEQMAKVIQGIQRSLQTQFAGMTTLSSDVVVSVDIRLLADASPESPPSG